MSNKLRDAMFLQDLEPIPAWLDADAVVTAEEWLKYNGKGWDIDGSAYWGVEGYRSRISAWSEKPTMATHVVIFHK